MVKSTVTKVLICFSVILQTNSMCFRKKSSCVRRRYSEFVWLRHCLEQNALIMYVQTSASNQLLTLIGHAIGFSKQFLFLVGYSVQRVAQIAVKEPLLQFEEPGTGRTEDEGLRGVFRKVSCF